MRNWKEVSPIEWFVLLTSGICTLIISTGYALSLVLRAVTGLVWVLVK